MRVAPGRRRFIPWGHQIIVQHHMPVSIGAGTTSASIAATLSLDAAGLDVERSPSKIRRMGAAGRWRSMIGIAGFLLLAACSHGPEAPAPVASARTTRPASTATRFGALTLDVSGQGPSVILVPGLACSASVFERILGPLRRRFRVHLVNLPGFAGAPAAEGGGPLARARTDLIAYVEALGEGPVAIVGHSVGGFVGFWVSSERPDLVRALVAIDGVPYLPALFSPFATPATVAVMAGQTRDRFGAMSPAQLREALQGTLIQMIPDAALREPVLREAARSSPAAVGAAQYEAWTVDLRSAVARIRSPVLLLVGTRDIPSFIDRGVLTWAYQTQVANIPSHRIEWLPGAGHFAFLDQPAEVGTKIESFIAAATGQR